MTVDHLFHFLKSASETVRKGLVRCCPVSMSPANSSDSNKVVWIHFFFFLNNISETDCLISTKFHLKHQWPSWLTCAYILRSFLNIFLSGNSKTVSLPSGNSMEESECLASVLFWVFRVAVLDHHGPVVLYGSLRT